MTASVDIEVARRTGAVVVPADAIHALGSGKPWVLALEDGRTRRREVKLGLRGDGRVEVIEGVAPGDLVVPATNLLIKPGERVRPVTKDGA